MLPWFVLFVVLVEGRELVGASEHIAPACLHLNQSAKTKTVNGGTRLEFRPLVNSTPQRAPFNATITINTGCHVVLDRIAVRFSGACLLTVSVVTEHGDETLLGPNRPTQSVEHWTYESFSLSGAARVRDLHHSNGNYIVFVQFLGTRRRTRACGVYTFQSADDRTGVRLYAQVTTTAPPQTTTNFTKMLYPATTSPQHITQEQTPRSAGGQSPGPTSKPANGSTVAFLSTTTTQDETQSMEKASSLLTPTHILLIAVLTVLLIALLVVILVAKQCRDGRLSCSMLYMCVRHPSHWYKSRAQSVKRKNTQESSEETPTPDSEPSAPALVSYRNTGHTSNVTLPDSGPGNSRKSSKPSTASPSTELFKTTENDQQPSASQEASKEHAYATGRVEMTNISKRTANCASEGTDPLYSDVGQDTKAYVNIANNIGDVQAASANDQGGISNPLYAPADGPPVQSSTKSAKSALEKDTRACVNTTPNTGIGHAPYTNVLVGDNNPLYALPHTLRARSRSKSDDTAGIQQEADQADPTGTDPSLDDPAALPRLGAEYSKGGEPQKSSAVPGAIYSQPVKSSKDGDPVSTPVRQRTHNLEKSAAPNEPDEEAQPPKVVPYKAHKILKSSSAGDDVTAGRPTSLLSSVLYQDPIDALLQEDGLLKQSRPSTEKDASLYASPFELQTRMTMGRAETCAEEEQSGDQQMATPVITAQSTTTTAVGASTTAAGNLTMASDASHAQSNTTNPHHGTDTESVTQGYASQSSDTPTTKTKSKAVVYSKVIVKPKKKGNINQTAVTSDGATAGANTNSRDEQPGDVRKAGGGDVIYTQVNMKAKKRSSMADQATAS